MNRHIKWRIEAVQEHLHVRNIACLVSGWRKFFKAVASAFAMINSSRLVIEPNVPPLIAASSRGLTLEGLHFRQATEPSK
jgi:hypothetical protein